MEHEIHIGENAEKKTEELHKKPSYLSPTQEQHEEPEVSPFINAAKKFPKTIHTLDKALESDLIIDYELKELHKHLYTTNFETKIEMDVKSINGVAEENLVEVKNNNVEKSEELASKYVDKQQSQSPTALKNNLTTQVQLQLPLQ